jgi:N-acetylneuraminic acid mutarotase
MRRVLLFWLAIGLALAHSSDQVLIEKKRPISFPSNLEGAACTFVEGSESLYVVGGRVGVNTWSESLFWVYDGKWNEYPVSKIQRSSHTAVTYKRNIYLFGGRPGLFTVTNDLLILDPIAPKLVKNVTNAKGTPPSPRHSHASAVVDGKMYVHGGATNFKGNETVGELFVYDIAANTWELVEIKEGSSGNRMGHQLVAYDGYLYAIGGHDGTGAEHSEVSKFSLATNSWSKAQFKFPRSGHTATLVGSTIWLTGGRSGEKQFFKDVVAWDVANNKKLSVKVDGEYSQRQGHCAALHPGKEGKPIYLFGGSESYSKYYHDLNILWVEPTSLQLRKKEVDEELSRGRSWQRSFPATAKPSSEQSRARAILKKATTAEKGAAATDTAKLAQRISQLLATGIPEPVDPDLKKKVEDCNKLDARMKPEAESREDLEAQRKTLQELEKELQAIQDEDQEGINKLADAVSTLQQEVAQWDDQLLDAEKNYQEHDRRKELIKLKLSSAQRERHDLLGKVDGAKLKQQRLEETKRRVEDKHNEAEDDVQKIDKAIQDAQTKEKEKKDEMKAKDAAIEEARKEEQRKKGSLTQTGVDKEKIRKKIVQIEKVLEENDSLKLKFEEAKQLTTEAEKARAQWIEDAKGTGEDFGSDSIDALQRTVCTHDCQLEISSTYITHMKKKLEEYRRQLQEVDETASSEESALDNIRKRIGELENAKWGIELEVRGIERDIDARKERREFHSQSLPRLKKELTDEVEKLSTLQKELENHQKEEKIVLQRIADNTKILEEEDVMFQNYDKTVDDLKKKKHDAMKRLEDAVDELEKKVDSRDRSRTKLANTMSGFGDTESQYKNYQRKHTQNFDVLNELRAKVFAEKPQESCKSKELAIANALIEEQKSEIAKLQSALKDSTTKLQSAESKLGKCCPCK